MFVALTRCLTAAVVAGLVVASTFAAQAADPPLTPLFPQDGPVGAGWVVGHWGDISTPAPNGPAEWVVKGGDLWGGKAKSGRWVGTWLFSEKEYSDFILEVGLKFMNGGANGNGGIGLRFPPRDRPSQSGFEIQFTDPRYETRLYPYAGPAQLTGSLYLVNPPKVQMYLNAEWNEYRIEARGPRIKVTLNGTVVQDVDLDTLTGPAKRHGKGDELLDATPGAQRPRRGRIGFQDLSERGEQLVFRNPRIAVLD